MLAWSEAGLSVAAGGLTALSPCVFPLLPLVLGGTMQRNRAAPLAMGLGMILLFVLLGVLVGVLGDALGLEPALVRTGAAAMLIAFGLLILSGTDRWLEGQVTDLMPEAWLQLTTRL